MALNDDSETRRAGVAHVLIRFLLMNAFSMGGTIRTTYNTAACLASRHEVEIVSVYRRRPTSRFTPDSRVPVRVLSDQVPPDGDIQAHPFGRCTGGEEVMRRVPSLLVPSSERRYRNFSLLTDVRLASFLRGFDGDVLVSTRPGLNLAAARLAKPSVVRVGQEHMFLENHAPALRRRIARQYPRLDLVSALTERDADDYRELLRGRTRVVRMPNAVPDPGIRATGDGKVVVAAGRLVWQKGFDLLVDSFTLVAQEHPDWQLHIYGSGPDKTALNERIRNRGLVGRVRLMGYTDRLSEEMSRAALYVMSSRHEGFPMVLLEAMAVGLPVVSFDCRNGPADIITHGEDGLLVADGDIPGLAAAVGVLIDHPEKRAMMGAAARAAAARYDLRLVCSRWEALFSELLDAKATSARGRRHG